MFNVEPETLNPQRRRCSPAGFR